VTRPPRPPLQGDEGQIPHCRAEPVRERGAQNRHVWCAHRPWATAHGHQTGAAVTSKRCLIKSRSELERPPTHVSVGPSAAKTIRTSRRRRHWTLAPHVSRNCRPDPQTQCPRDVREPVAVSETETRIGSLQSAYIDSANRSWAHLISSARQLRASARHCTAVFSGLERREPGLRFSCLSGLLVGKTTAGLGFEPRRRLHAQRFSRPPRSTAPAPRPGSRV
jgi:hypothetical protein